MASGKSSDAVVEGILLTVPRWARFLGQELEQLDPPLSVRQFLVLQRIDAGTSRTTDLARAVRVTSPTMTRVIDRLVEIGFVRREADQDDRRAIRLGLTPAGRRVLARHSRTLAAGIRALLDEAGTTAEEFAIVKDACAILSGAIDIRRAKEKAAATRPSRDRSPQRVG